MKLVNSGREIWGAPVDETEIELGWKDGNPAVVVKGVYRYGNSSQVNCIVIADPDELFDLAQALMVIARRITFEESA